MEQKYYKYFYSVPDKNGYPIAKCTLLTREDYIRIVHIDLVTQKVYQKLI